MVITALVIAMVMMVAMAVTAMAVVTPQTNRNNETDGSVSVSNAKTGQTYTLYRLFQADMGANDAITYTLPAGKTAADLTYNSKSWFELNDNGFVVAKSTTTDEWAKDPDAILWAKSFGSTVGDPITAGTVSWTGLEYGYYFVDTTLGSFIGVDSANKAASISEKNDEPKLDKEITGVTTPGGTKSTATLGEGDDKTDIGEGVNEKAIAQVGDTVGYKLTVHPQPGAENYVVTDTLTNLKLTASTVKINGTDYSASTIVDRTESSVVNEASSFTIVFTKAYLDSLTAADTITIEYDAVITGTAVTVGEGGNENTAKLTYGHSDNDDINYSEDKAKVYTAKISVVKHDGDGAGLADATFALKRDSDSKYYVYNTTTGVVTWESSVDSATKFTSDTTGALDGEFKGLPNGSYTLEETHVPDGYNAIDPADSSLKFTIDADNYTNDNLVQDTTVINNAGAVLPSTGGIGTTIFYIVGAILVIGAGILLVTRRRMNAN